MKQQILILISTLLLVPGIINGQSPSATWLRYTVKGEEFSVILPDIPTLKSSPVSQTRPRKDRQEKMLEAKTADGQVYAVYFYENLKPQLSLEDFIAEQNKDSRLNPSTARNVTIGKLQGKEYLSQDTKATEQFFVTNKRLYRFVVRGVTAEQDEVMQFFFSIMFGENEDGIEVNDGVPIQPGASEKIYFGKEVDRRARLLNLPEPTYTEAARKHRVAGVVVLRGVVSPTGKLTHIRVIVPLPFGLTEQAIEAARKTTFVPAVKDGKNVPMWMQLEYNFNL